jgi:hypothetical protein
VHKCNFEFALSHVLERSCLRFRSLSMLSCKPLELIGFVRARDQNASLRLLWPHDLFGNHIEKSITPVLLIDNCRHNDVSRAKP